MILADRREDFLDELKAELAPLGTFTDYRDALTLEPEAAIICTPNSLHAQMAVACVEAGCHLLVEKPIAHTREAAGQVVEAARRHQRVAAVGYVLRFWSGVAEVKALLEEGRIGAPLAARVMVGAYETLTYARTDWRDANPDEGGPLLDYSHEFDYLRWYLGEVDEVACMGARAGPDGERLITIAACILRFRSGALAQVHIDYLQHPARRELEIIGEDGRLLYDFRGMWAEVTDREGEVSRTEWSGERDEAFRGQLEAFIVACQGGPSRVVEAGDAAKTLSVAVAGAESAEKGVFVPVPA